MKKKVMRGCSWNFDKLEEFGGIKRNLELIISIISVLGFEICKYIRNCSFVVKIRCARRCPLKTSTIPGREGFVLFGHFFNVLSTLKCPI